MSAGRVIRLDEPHLNLIEQTSLDRQSDQDLS
jgi:hypothetical protein